MHKGDLTMALRWQWNECIGELEIENQNKARIKIYQGNALLIFLNEWKGENGEDLWSMYNFFADKGHFDNCRKDKGYNYAKGWLKLTLWTSKKELFSAIQKLLKENIKR